MIPLLCALLFGWSTIGVDLAEAERAYRDARYQDALALYQGALAHAAAPEGALLLNLGNCSYRLGRYAEAVLFYRRAQLRRPGDAHLELNLRLAEQQLGIYEVREPAFGSRVVAWLDALPPARLLAAVLALQTVALLGLMFLRSRPRLRSALTVLLILGLLGAARLVQTQCFPDPPQGVVLAPELGLRPEPHPDYPTTVELRAGETVDIEESSDRWARVTSPRGTGWVRRDGVGLVD